MKFDIPKGKFSSGDANAGKRKKLLESLRSGEEVRVKSDGSIQQKGDADKDHDAVKLPKGKLAFHWYEDDVACYICDTSCSVNPICFYPIIKNIAVVCF